jgi:hypothetical protein
MYLVTYRRSQIVSIVKTSGNKQIMKVKVKLYRYRPAQAHGDPEG